LRTRYWQTFILTAIAIGGYELMAMKIRHRGSASGVRCRRSRSRTIIFEDSAAAVYGVVLLIILGAMVWSLLQEDPLHDAGVRVGWLIGTPVYVGGGMVALALVRDFAPTGAWVLMTMVLAWGSDTAAYFVGRKFGKTKLAPRISPKKTIEGAAAGLTASVGAVIMSFCLIGLTPSPLCLEAAGLRILVSVPMQQRSADSGGILPSWYLGPSGCSRSPRRRLQPTAISSPVSERTAVCACMGTPLNRSQREQIVNDAR
jgi:CDP-diglyceride synthetase